MARFGVTIYFGSPDKKEFQEIVRVLAQRGGIDMPEEQLLLEANKWELAMADCRAGRRSSLWII